MKIKLMDLLKQLNENEDFDSLQALVIIHAAINEIILDKELKNKLTEIIEEYMNDNKYKVEVEINLGEGANK